jgi:hypothetical protein
MTLAICRTACRNRQEEVKKSSRQYVVGLMDADNTNTVSFDFELDPKSAYEGMLLGGQRVYRGGGRLILLGLYFELFVLIPFGCVAIYVTTATLVFDKLPDGAHWLLIASLPGFFLGWYLNQSAYRRLAKMVARSKFGHAGQMRFDEKGLCVNTQASTWRTGWRDVEEILIGKRCISFAISGIVLILPLSAFESTAAMHQTYTQVSKMFEQGQNAT